MRFLYQHIQFKLGDQLPPHKTWETARIEMIFSVPTTWAPHPTVERFRSIILRAGFGQHPPHSVSVGLTEAEAAAVNTSVDSPGIFQENEVLLVCDAGGGTTDLSVLRVQDVASGALSLKQLDVVVGRNLGSVFIDPAFEDLVLHRLQEANRHAPMAIDLDEAAWHLMKSRAYQNAKCEFGYEHRLFSSPL
jgi:molecular chaperone DnaK (HSP70)